MAVVVGVRCSTGRAPTVLARWFVVPRASGLVVSRNCIPPAPRWFRDARHRVWQTASYGAAAAY
jgi:hypothetical protein